MVVGLVVLWINGVVALAFSAGLASNLIVGATVLFFFIYTFKCGYLNYQVYKQRKHGRLDPLLKEQLNDGWFYASICSRLGLLGTVWGFIIVSQALTMFKVGDPTSVQTMVTGMASGMAVALITTLVGQICNICLSLQYHILNQKIVGE